MSSGCSTMMLACLVILGIALGRGVHGYGNGAAHPACTHMHVAHGEYQRGPSPYSISMPDSPTKYSAGNQVKLCIRATENWRGTLVQARRANNPDITPVGTWSQEVPADTRLMTCTMEADSITHANTKTKDDNLCFLWQPPAQPVGDVFFIATVATTKDIWWMNLTTPQLTPEVDYGSSGSSGSYTIHYSAVLLLLSVATKLVLS